ncbi:hypothetical protein KEJ34_00155 [Candidatus Bathyarchaeota archaeon]|nr:hypothetical protein [Candidatus Bathyarchaeota archaeon]
MVRISYAYLLNDSDVRRWFKNVARGLRVTADIYLRRLGGVCERLGLDPKALIGLSDRELAAVLTDFISSLEREVKAGCYA